MIAFSVSHRIFGLLMVVGIIALAGIWLDYRRFQETPLAIPPEGFVYKLASGGNSGSVERDLMALGFLNRPLYLRVLAWERGVATRLKAGEYQILAGTTPLRLLDLLTSGRVVQYPITLVEGWTFSQVRQALREVEWIHHTLGEVPAEEIMARLGRPGVPPEGHFLPETYHFPRGTTDLEILRRALRAMDRVLATAWEKRTTALPLESPEQALILASIVEKETGLAAERPQIAGVILRRLQRGMRLQTDPTVIYGLGDAFDGNLRRADLRQDTPYNTYLHQGLPPTPIALPGRAAIQAALHPAVGNALYFVARGDGGHVFSATLEAHNRAVREYQLKRGVR